MNIEVTKVAVLCAVYNGEKFLEEQVESILNQYGIVIHLYISVDLSSDGSYEFCKALEEKHKSITVLPYGERFGGAARNFYRLIRDIDFSQYDYIALSDQDDIWLEKKLMKAIEYIKKKGFDAYSSNVMAVWDDGREVLVNKAFSQVKYDYFFEAAGPGCTYVLRNDSLGKFKAFMLENERAVWDVDLHDWMIYAFFRSRGMNWHIDEWVSMFYRQHASNQVGFNSGVRAFFKRFALVKKKWYRSEVEKIYDLVATDLTALKLNRWFLLGHWWQLRRRMRDKFVLLAFILFGIF